MLRTLHNACISEILSISFGNFPTGCLVLCPDGYLYLHKSSAHAHTVRCTAMKFGVMNPYGLWEGENWVRTSLSHGGGAWWQIFYVRSTRSSRLMYSYQIWHDSPPYERKFRGQRPLIHPPAGAGRQQSQIPTAKRGLITSERCVRLNGLPTCLFCRQEPTDCCTMPFLLTTSPGMQSREDCSLKRSQVVSNLLLLEQK